MSQIIQKVKHRYKITKKSTTIFSIALFASILTLLLMNLMANISSFWSIDNTTPQLPDFIFESLDKRSLSAIVDILMNTFITTTMLCILLCRNAIAIYFRFFVCIICCYFLRMSVVSITNIPPPNDGCIKIVRNMFTTFTYKRCGDLIFSGHTLIVMICAMIWSSYNLLINTTLSKIGCICAWTVSFTIFMFILMTRNHYTVDVLLSIHITGAVWIIYGFVWEKYLSKEDIFQCIIIDD